MSRSNHTGAATQPDELPAPLSRIIILTFIALGSGVAATACLARASYHAYTGYLQAKSRTVTSGRDARVIRVLANPGAVIARGTPLLLLQDVELEAQRAGKQREVATLQAEVSQVHAKAAIELSALRRRLESEIFDVKLTLAQYHAPKLSTNDGESSPAKTATHFEPLAPPKTRGVMMRQARFQALEATHNPVGTGHQADSILGTWTDSHAQVELCNGRLTDLERNLDDLPDQILEANGVSVVQARLDRATEELARLDQQERALSLVAEAHGTVGVFRKQPGDYVDSNEPIVELLDEDQPYLIVQIPSAMLVDFKPSTKVGLRFPGGIVGEGQVESIPPQVAALPRPGSRVDEEDTLITVHIVPVGAVWPQLPFGSAIEVRR